MTVESGWSCTAADKRQVQKRGDNLARKHGGTACEVLYQMRVLNNATREVLILPSSRRNEEPCKLVLAYSGTLRSLELSFACRGFCSRALFALPDGRN